MLYLFWDVYLIEDDPCFVFFISLAMVIINKTTIMSIDRSILPQTMANLKIATVDDLKKIYQKSDLLNYYH